MTIESTPAFYVPTVDIGPFLSDPSSPECDAIIKQIRAACLSTGFFVIKNHGIPTSLQKSVFEAAAKFFALPFEEKKALDAKTNVGHRGYDVLASQSYEADVLPDLKEARTTTKPPLILSPLSIPCELTKRLQWQGYFIGQDVPTSDPRVRAGRFFMGTNVWPSLPPGTFRKPVEAYFAAIHALSIQVLNMLARTLPYGPQIFDDFVSHEPATPLRLLHYPPMRRTEQRQLGASAHTDFGALTLLLQDGTSGLQVLDAATETWVPIAPDPEGYVVNIGDMLSLWTGGLYKSSVHRVLNENPKDRYSVVFFFDGNLDCPLRPLDGSQVDDDQVLTVEGHMIKRMTESYGGGKR